MGNNYIIIKALALTLVCHRDDVSPVAVRPYAVVPAAQAVAGGSITVIAVAVAGTAPAGWKAPVPRQAALAPSPVRPWHTGTLPAQLVAEWVLGSLGITLTHCNTNTGQKHL